MLYVLVGITTNRVWVRVIGSQTKRWGDVVIFYITCIDENANCASFVVGSTVVTKSDKLKMRVNVNGNLEKKKNSGVSLRIVSKTEYAEELLQYSSNSVVQYSRKKTEMYK